jgi:hypothetical protein
MPDGDTLQNIMNLQKVFCSRNAERGDSIHSTIIYSKDIIPAKDIKIKLPDSPIIGRNPRLDIFQTDDDGDVLVLLFDCMELCALHEIIKQNYNLRTKYDFYRPHITLEKNYCFEYPNTHLSPFRIVLIKDY